MEFLRGLFGGGEERIVTIATPQQKNNTEVIAQEILEDAPNPSSIPSVNTNLSNQKIEQLPLPPKEKQENIIELTELSEEEFLFPQNTDLELENPPKKEPKKTITSTGTNPPKTINDTPSTDTASDAGKKDGCCKTHCKTFTIATLVLAMSVAAVGGLAISRNWIRRS